MKSAAFILVLTLTASNLALAASPLAQAKYVQAVKALTEGDFPAALSNFEDAVRADPNDLLFGAEYRQAIIKTEEYDRALAFFADVAAKETSSANLLLNYGFCYVDKVPTEGAVTQVLLAHQAIEKFTAALEIEESWLGLYTRGNSYVFWPPIFGLAPLGVADLTRAIELAKRLERKPYHARAWAALGDGYWRLGDVAKGRGIWQEGLKLFPDSELLQVRLSQDDAAVDAYLEETFAVGRRVATDLREIWEQ
jgi:tetratricopeptide (TPR) repeat protein